MIDFTSSSDEELVIQYKAGQEKAFDELFQRYAGKIKRLIFFYLGGNDMADDVFQDVFIRVYRHIEKFNTSMTFSSWVYQIAINCCKNYIKKVRHNDDIIEKEKIRLRSSDTFYATPEQQVVNELDIAEFNRAVDSLDLKFKDVFVLRFDHKMKYQDIAEVLDCSERTAKWRMKKAVTMIIHVLKESSII